MATVVEELIIKLGIEGDEKKIQNVMGSLEDLAKVGAIIAGAFTAVAYGAFHMVEAVATAADNAAAAAERLNITTQSLQSLEHAALMSDATTEGLANGLKFLGKNAAEAAQNGGEMAEAFARAGVKVKDGAGNMKGVDVLLNDMADAFQNKIPKGAEQTAMVMKIFGRTGLELIPLLNKGAAGIAELQRKAVELGVVMSTELIAAGAKFDDQMKELQASFTGLRNTIAGPFVEAFGEVLARLTKFIQMNRKLIATKLANFFKIVAGAANLFIDALEWLFESQGRIDSVLFTLTTGLLGAGAAFVFLKGQAIGSALATAAAWSAASIVFLLIGAFIALLADDLAVFVSGGDSMIGRLIAWTTAIDPDDNQITKTLKLWLALLFDFTDPKKWQAVKDNMKSLIFGNLGTKETMTQQQADASQVTSPTIRGAMDFLNGMMGIKPIQQAPGLDDYGNPAGGTTRVSAPITINVPPGTTPENARDYVKEAISEHFNTVLQEAGAVAGKGN